MVQKAPETLHDQDALFTQIAQQYLDIETLKTRRMDALDFHDCAVWSIKDALQAAYDAGVKAASEGDQHAA